MLQTYKVTIKEKERISKTGITIINENVLVTIIKVKKVDIIQNTKEFNK